MPKAKFTAEGYGVYRNGVGYLNVTLGGHGYDWSNREARYVADALNAAEENRDRPWVGDGPSVAEAGGESILARIPDGDLVRFVWNHTLSEWTSAAFIGTPVGWRPMPKE